MENSVYLALSKQKVLRTDMQIIANNVANMNTSGYRAQNTMFSEYISDPRGSDEELSFVYDTAQYQVTAEGPLEQTNNPLDVALVGPGFIGVQGAGNGPSYTRAGNLEIGVDGLLQTSSGFPVVDAGGATITIPDNASEIKIDYQGRISTENGEIGQIQIVEFDNVQDLEAQGNNLYTTNAATQEPTNTVMRQGFVEGSNVNPVLEMTRMIDTLRTFQSVQRTMQGEHERLRDAIQKLTRST